MDLDPSCKLVWSNSNDFISFQLQLDANTVKDLNWLAIGFNSIVEMVSKHDFFFYYDIKTFNRLHVKLWAGLLKY